MVLYHCRKYSLATTKKLSAERRLVCEARVQMRILLFRNEMGSKNMARMAGLKYKLNTKILKLKSPPIMPKSSPNNPKFNLYEGGQASVSRHSDDEVLFDARAKNSLIISVYLGAARRFQIRTKKGNQFITEKRLNSGDILTMAGMF